MRLLDCSTLEKSAPQLAPASNLASLDFFVIQVVLQVATKLLQEVSLSFAYRCFGDSMQKER